MIYYGMGVLFVASAIGVWVLFNLVWPHPALTQPAPKRTGIALTPAAAQQFRQLAVEVKDGDLLRLKMQEGAGGNYVYDARTESRAEPDDLRFESQGVTILVDPRSLEMLDGTILDWRSDATGAAGFFFDNPNSA